MRQDETSENVQEVERLLNQLASRIDLERFPGRAWPAIPASVKPRVFRMVWPVAGVAAALVLAVSIWSGQETSRHPPLLVQGSPEAGLPQTILIEDLDSYSMIELSGRNAVITFTRKRSSGMPPAIAVLSRSEDR
jgi:hypothetical protein